MARPRKYDIDMVTQQIMDVFWAKGFEATSLSDLMAATQLKKGSLYAFYGDKAGMFQRALLTYQDVAVGQMVAKMDQLPARAALQALMAAPAIPIMAGDRRGCFLCNSLTEFEHLDAPSQGLATRSREAMLAVTERALVRLDTPVSDVKNKAMELIALYFGLHVLARGNAPAAQIEAVGISALAGL